MQEEERESRFSRFMWPHQKPCPEREHGFWLPCAPIDHRKCPACNRNKKGEQTTRGKAPIPEEVNS